jgi:N-acetylglucosamine kinase-like BadF-type ATPase
MMRENWYIGVDGGGSKTHLVLCDRMGEVRLRGSAGPTNHQSTDRAADNFTALLEPVRTFVDSHPGSIVAAAVFAVSGWDFPRDQKILSGNIGQALQSTRLNPGKLICENDIFAVLKGGLMGDAEGVCLIAGSGVLGAAVAPDFTWRTWGLDYSSGEWGSGTNIGHEGVHRVLSSAQGREEPCPRLETRALAFFGVSNPSALAESIGSPDFDPALYTRFSAQVFEAGSEGCPGALSVLHKGGEAHARTVAALLKRFDGRRVPLVLGGGVFQHNGILPGFHETLDRLGTLPSETRILKSDPVWGSLLWACQEGGLNTRSLAFASNIVTIRSQR